ncbi:hypothetical protein LINGRAHAP2_LOCUS16067, partial [Linum grandiflorum]
REFAKKAYRFGLPPLVGKQAWPETIGLTVYPPKSVRLPGRPRTERRKEAGELGSRPTRNGSGTEVLRTGLIMHCRRCGAEGHNVRRCTEPVPAQTHEPQPPPASTTPTPLGRPPRAARTEPSDTRRQTRNTTRNAQPDPQAGFPTIQTERRKRRCSLCSGDNHNARTCLRQRGIQANQVQPTSRREQ